MRTAIAALPDGQRQAVALFYLEGLTQAEAGAEIGTRPGAIKTRLHKARRSLRVSLQATYEEYIDMTEQIDQDEQLIPMRVAELRRTHATESGMERHILFLEDDHGRRLPIWIGSAEATAMALVLEQVQLPRPGVYQFAASLLTAGGGRLREVRVTELTQSTFYAQAILTDDSSVDARPSDALTLALMSEAPVYVTPRVLEQAQETSGDWNDLIEEADTPVDDSRVIAADAVAAYAALVARLPNPED